MGQFAVINLLIARRYSKSEKDLVLINRNIEQRVDEKAREIEAVYEESRALEREHTLSAERARLMRDVHDGLGGQLIQALAMSEREDAWTELRESLGARRLIACIADRSGSHHECVAPQWREKRLNFRYGAGSGDSR